MRELSTGQLLNIKQKTEFNKKNKILAQGAVFTTNIFASALLVLDNSINSFYPNSSKIKERGSI